MNNLTIAQKLLNNHDSLEIIYDKAYRQSEETRMLVKESKTRTITFVFSDDSRLRMERDINEVLFCAEIDNENFKSNIAIIKTYTIDSIILDIELDIKESTYNFTIVDRKTLSELYSSQPFDQLSQARSAGLKHVGIYYN